MHDALAVIGGSGLSQIEGVRVRRARRIATPFGPPSDAIVEGELHGRTVYFLPRHGVGHRLLPSEINYRANVWALKKLGARSLLSVSAVGSLQARLRPGDFVLVDQYVDRTKGVRASTFFGDGCVGHVALAEPICGALAGDVAEAAKALRLRLHRGGTYVCMEGPQFSTRAESRLNHAAGHAVIGMTNVPEAYLAREAGLCYASISMVTDYDSWSDREEVSADAAIAVMKQNVARVTALLSKTIAAFEDRPECACRRASQFAVMTDPKRVPRATKAALSVVLGH